MSITFDSMLECTELVLDFLKTLFFGCFFHLRMFLSEKMPITAQMSKKIVNTNTRLMFLMNLMCYIIYTNVLSIYAAF